MTIILGIVIGIIIFVIAFIIGKVSEVEPLPGCCLECMNKHHNKCGFPQFTQFCCDHYGIDSLRNEIDILRRCNEELRRKVSFIESKSCPMIHAIRNEPCRCGSRIYAKTIEDQKIMDLLIKGLVPLEELKDKLTK